MWHGAVKMQAGERSHHVGCVGVSSANLLGIPEFAGWLGPYLSYPLCHYAGVNVQKAI